MRRFNFYVLSILLVPWTMSCQGTKTSPDLSESSDSTKAQQILPPSRDTTLPSGRRNIYLVSDRNYSGLFVERSTFPVGYDQGTPHTHSSDFYITVLDGAMYFAFGEKYDTTLKMKPYGPGSFIIVPAGKPHYEWFKQKSVLEIIGVGPVKTIYLSQ